MSSPPIRHVRSYTTTCVACASGKAPKANTVRVQTAYKPVFPDYIENAPSFRHGRPPPILPFFKEKSHTVPTKWSLYRPLIRATYGGTVSSRSALRKSPLDTSEASPNITPKSISLLNYPNLRRRLRLNWKKQRAQTSMLRTRNYLTTQYALLSILLSPSATDLQSLSVIEARLARIYARQDELALRRANRPKLRSRLTGGLIYPSHFAPPLPRMKPQPTHWSGMIRSRIRARHKRMETMREQEEWIGDMVHEERFLRNLAVPSPEPWDESGVMGWKRMLREEMTRYHKLFEKDTKRSEGKFTVEDMERILKAKKVHRRKYQSFRREKNEARRDKETKRAMKLSIDASQKRKIKIKKD